MSGEQPAEQLVMPTTPSKQANASDIAATNVAKREVQKEYLEYWNSTKELTSTGRPIDALLAPAAPFAAARPKLFTYLGYTVWVNLFDYTSVVIPITNVDKTVDKIDEGFEPLNDIDKKTYECCKDKTVDN